MPKKKVTEEHLEEVQLEQVKLALRNKINKEYGSVPAFLETDFGKSLGGMKIRPYLYGTGSVNYTVIAKLCTYFGIGNLTHKVKVIRKTYYYISKP